MRIDENKTELFSFLADQAMLVQCKADKQVISTEDETTLFRIHRNDTTSLCPCTHEEADTRLLLRALDASAKGCKRVMLRTVDTDVVVLSIAMDSKINAESFWITFGVGKNFRYISAKAIAANLGMN